MEWNEFVQRLARELTHLPDSAFLVVQLPGGVPYVQAMRNSDGLSAEVVSNEFLPVPLRLGPEQDARLTEIGWQPPGQHGHLNWWQQVRLPVEFDDFTPEEAVACGRLAGAMATALNEVFRVRSPFDLEYHANQGGPERGPIELPYFGLRRAASAPRPDRVAGSSSAALPITKSSVATPSVGRPSVSTSSVATASSTPAGVPLPPSTPARPTRLRPGRPQSPPGPVSARSEAELEDLLAAAKDRGDQPSYFELLLLADLVMPSTGDPKAERFATAAFDDGTYVLAFTSRDAMEQSLRGQAGYHRRTSFMQLARDWPKPEWRLAINAGLPTAAYIDSDTITRLADEERWTDHPRAATTAVEREFEPAPEPDPAPQAETSPPHTGPTIMQKVVPHQHVTHYLENAYDQVAGYVHRVQDEDAMRKAPDGWVVERPPFLGTGYAPGEGESVPEFKIDSQRLPHGAEMHRVYRSGTQIFVAFFDADHRRWTKAQEA